MTTMGVVSGLVEPARGAGFSPPGLGALITVVRPDKSIWLSLLSTSLGRSSVAVLMAACLPGAIAPNVADTQALAGC